MRTSDQGSAREEPARKGRGEGHFCARLCWDCNQGKRADGGKLMSFGRWRCADCVAARQAAKAAQAGAAHG